MNWPFKVHKLEPSVMPVCETRREGGGGEQSADVTEAERNTARVTGRKLDKLQRAKRGETNKNESEKDGVNERVRQWDHCVGRTKRTNASNASFHREQSGYGSYHSIMMITQGLWNGHPLRGRRKEKKNGKKEQSQANTAGSKIYAEEKLQDIQLQRLCVCS